MECTIANTRTLLHSETAIEAKAEAEAEAEGVNSEQWDAECENDIIATCAARRTPRGGVSNMLQTVDIVVFVVLSIKKILWNGIERIFLNVESLFLFLFSEPKTKTQQWPTR